MKVLKSYLWPVITGLVIGWLLDPGDVQDRFYKLYDAHFPVATLVASRTVLVDGTSEILISGIKHRKCTLDTIVAYDTGLIGSERIRLNVSRKDGTHSIERDVGPFTGTIPYRVVPPTIGTLNLYARHFCGDRHVMTPITIK